MACNLSIIVRNLRGIQLVRKTKPDSYRY